MLGLPAVIANVESQKLCFMIDSGSSHNVLDKSVYNTLKENIQDVEERFSLYGLEGNKQVVNRAKMGFNICDVEFDATFNIADMTATFEHIKNETGLQLHGLLGMDFLVKNKWAIDFGNNVIIIPIIEKKNE